MSDYRVTVTSQRRLLRAPEKQRHDDCLDMIATAGETTEFGTLYLIDNGRHIKAGIATQTQVANRVINLQTGSSEPLRVVTLCFFFSPEVARSVETELKRRHAPRRTQGGTEWFSVPREELRRDVLAVAHELAFRQMQANATGVAAIRPQQAKYFYGLLMFDIENGELRASTDATPPIDGQDAGPTIPSDDELATKRGLWDRLLGLVGISG